LFIPIYSIIASKNKKNKLDNQPAFISAGLQIFSTWFSALTYSRSIELPSALASLTAEFGMGSGVTLPLEAPRAIG
jgi:hypothetical protein